MSNIVKSTFRQRKIERIYSLCSEQPNLWNRVVCLSTYAQNANILADEIIGQYDVEIPMLEVGDEFFLHNIGKIVKIKKRMRSSDNTITYYVEDDFVETERSEKTKAECEYKLCNKEELEAKVEEIQQKFDDYKSEYKYKHRFFNFR